jgi:hypothetical protein
MVTVLFAVAEIHPPDAAISLVMVYVPGALVAKSISPVLVLTKFNPAGTALNRPALAPALKVGNGFVCC